MYKGAIHEYQILQKDWSPNIEWSSLLSEKLPIVIRNVSVEWIGQWNRHSTERKSWPIFVKGSDGQVLKATWNEWLASPPGEPLILNGDELAAASKIPMQNWKDGGFSSWSWLPTIANEVGVLGPDPSSVRAVQKTTAAATIVQATDGIPMQIWLAHEGAVPDFVAPTLKGSNPWVLKSEQVPWIE